MDDLPDILNEQLADESVAKVEVSGGKYDMVEIRNLVFADYNPRTLSQHDFESLQRSIDEFGFVEPVVVNKRGNVIVGGHQRVRAAGELGYTAVPVVWVDLAKNKEIALNVALNKISGEFDNDVLAELLHDLDDEALILTGFNDDELSNLQDGWVDLEAAQEAEKPKSDKEPSFTIKQLSGLLNSFKEQSGSTDAYGFLKWLNENN